jgi:hypothetical protein
MLARPQPGPGLPAGAWWTAVSGWVGCQARRKGRRSTGPEQNKIMMITKGRSDAGNKLQGSRPLATLMIAVKEPPHCHGVGATHSGPGHAHRRHQGLSKKRNQLPGQKWGGEGNGEREGEKKVREGTERREERPPHHLTTTPPPRNRHAMECTTRGSHKRKKRARDKNEQGEKCVCCSKREAPLVFELPREESL